MSEYEMVNMLSNIASVVASLIMNFVTILSGYLLVAWFLARQLTATMALVLTGLFITFSMTTVLQVRGAMISMIGLTAEIRSYAAEGRGLSWHSAGSVPDYILEIFPVITIGVLLISIILAVFFFYHSRRMQETEVD